MDQKLWEFAASLRLYRATYEEVKYFCEFACKIRSPMELKFMLQVRTVVKITTVGRLIPQAIDFSVPQYVDLDRAVATVNTVFNSLSVPNDLGNEVRVEAHVSAQNPSFVPSKLQILALNLPNGLNAVQANEGWISLISLLDVLAFTMKQQESRVKVYQWACRAFEIVDENHDGFITLNQFRKIFVLVQPKVIDREIRISFERASKNTQELSFHAYCQVAISILSPALSIGSASHIVRKLPSHDEIRESIQDSIYITHRKRDHPDIADAKHILKTIATHWAVFAKLVVNYIQLMYHTDDEDSIDLAKEIDDARIELHHALVGDQEGNNTNAPPHDVKRAINAIHYYRKILVGLSKHQTDHQRQVILLPNKDSVEEEFNMLQQSILLQWNAAKGQTILRFVASICRLLPTINFY